jgi:hypothetical protein
MMMVQIERKRKTQRERERSGNFRSAEKNVVVFGLL